MTIDIITLLKNSDRAYLIAPAGCGKTEVIARAVSNDSGGRQLILTHTHAGVSSLRNRLKRMGVSQKLYHVETIAGWSLRYAAAYSNASGLVQAQPTGQGWQTVYEAVIKLLQHPFAKKIVTASYHGVYVDEYQDCTALQHSLVMILAEILPCRILGDPLQGIFGFQDDPLVNWDTDIAPNFRRLPDLTTPWRWKDKNEELGDWLSGVRDALGCGEEVDLSTGPINWLPISSENQKKACLDLVEPNGGSVIAIRKWPNDCHDFTRLLHGKYTSMEEMECRDLLNWSIYIQNAIGPGRANKVLEFGSLCLTKNSPTIDYPELRSARLEFAEGQTPNLDDYDVQQDLVAQLIQIASTEDMSLVRPVLQQIAELSGLVLFRRELWHEMIRTLKEFERNTSTSLREIAWDVRDRTRILGRRVDQRSVSRTLLIKGLEFDHAVVLNADELDFRNLYVAMTRGTRSLTLLSDNPVIQRPL